MTGEFSVVQFFANDTWERVRDHVDAETAVKAAHTYCHSVGARLGVVTRVMIEDGDGYCNFLWEFGQGIVYPTQEERDAARRQEG